MKQTKLYNVRLNLIEEQKNKKSYGTAKGIWVATLIDNIWALQMRSMIPVSGKISSLAGTKMSNGNLIVKP